jgi:hypothetical protein
MTKPETCFGGCWYLAQGFRYCKTGHDGSCILEGREKWAAYQRTEHSLPSTVGCEAGFDGWAAMMGRGVPVHASRDSGFGDEAAWVTLAPGEYLIPSGLDPTGERDSTAAVQALLDAGASLPPGTYLVSGEIDVPGGEPG